MHFNTPETSTSCVLALGGSLEKMFVMFRRINWTVLRWQQRNNWYLIIQMRAELNISFPVFHSSARRQKTQHAVSHSTLHHSETWWCIYSSADSWERHKGRNHAVFLWTGFFPSLEASEQTSGMSTVCMQINSLMTFNAVRFRRLCPFHGKNKLCLSETCRGSYRSVPSEKQPAKLGRTLRVSSLL